MNRATKGRQLLGAVEASSITLAGVKVTASAAELNKLDGVGTVVASGTQAAAIANEDALTGGQSPTEAEYNALLVKFNDVLAALRAFGIVASA